jgi:hypothetical protein
MTEEIFPQLHQVSRLLEAEVKFLRNQQEVIVIYHIFGLLLQASQKETADCHHAPVLANRKDTVGSLIHTKPRPWLMRCYIVIIIIGSQPVQFPACLVRWPSLPKDYMGSIHYLYKMEEESSSQIESLPAATDAPFLVVYHYRQRRHEPKPRLPRLPRHPAPTHSIILTRKMAAQLEGRTHLLPPATNTHREEQFEEE